MNRPYFKRIKDLRDRKNNVSSLDQETIAKNPTVLESVTKYTTLFRTLTINIMLLLLIFFFVYDFILSMRENNIKIKAVSMPKSLENVGYSKRSIEKRVRSEISTILKTSSDLLPLPQLSESGSEIDIDIAGSGIRY